ncbi:hypothetical protein GCM10009682_32380 [Luedemannella flava]|uniref:XRE family transcriptional regulator n=1 Tax=Luedemannella flava TaxID=349316 RepID=A0ABN2M3M3_9ACTN
MARTVDPRFAERMRDLLAERAVSYRVLAARTYYAKTYLHALATGAKSPTLEAAARIDDALAADGELVGYINEPAGSDGAAASRDSARLVELLCGGQVVDALDAAALGAHQLSVDYLSSPPDEMLRQATQLRRTAMAVLPRLHGRARAAEETDLLLALGHMSGVLAYAALDLGDAAAAAGHARAAWQCADTIDHHGLRAWVRGTQSLICRFGSGYGKALTYARDGMHYAHDGAAQARLLCGQAQSHANIGDGPAARRELTAAADAHGREHTPADGLFGFSAAKLAYYSGSTLIWLDHRDDAEHAQTESLRAIGLWEVSDPHERSMGDEALARVYLATARLQLHQLEGAVAALAPILDLPEDRKLSWIGKRLARIAEILAAAPYTNDPVARELGERIHAF